MVIVNVLVSLLNTSVEVPVAGAGVPNRLGVVGAPKPEAVAGAGVEAPPNLNVGVPAGADVDAPPNAGVAEPNAGLPKLPPGWEPNVGVVFCAPKLKAITGRS